MRGDGAIDEKEERIVEAIAAWMGLYGEAVYGTRPWRRFGEGPTRIKAGMFAEHGAASPYGAHDIRCVTRGRDVHGLVLGSPADGVVRLTALGSGAPGDVARVTMPGVLTRQLEPLSRVGAEMPCKPLIRHR